MLKHTKKIKEIYEDIQRRIFYMIPEKWEKIYLYASVIDKVDKKPTGELFFYYIPKGILKKKPVNVYEIPQKFNLDENEYIELVRILYKKVIILREEFKKIEQEEKTWSNLTISIEGIKFKVEYDYENLNKSNFTSKERHIIWRYKNLGIKETQLNKEDKEILQRYLLGEKVIKRKEEYEEEIYIKNVKNIVDYDTENYSYDENIEYIATEGEKVKNEIILSVKKMEEMKKQEIKN